MIVMPEASRTRRFTADEVYRMLAAGVLQEDEPVELLCGELIVVSPQGAPHSGHVAWLAERLRQAYGAGFYVREEKPLDAGARSQPEPDLAVARGDARTAAARHPRGEEVALVVEVAATSHALDRAKAFIYAHAGVPAYWLLDLAARTLEVYEGPAPDGYRNMARLCSDDEVRLPASDLAWRVADLFID